MTITTLENQIIHYEAIGHGAPVIFVHGWHGSWRYWYSTCRRFGRHRSYAFDLWGFGDSGANSTAYSLDAYVEMLHGTIGGALGAGVVLRYSMMYPEDVDRGQLFRFLKGAT